MRLILASTSSYRKAQLTQLGVTFEAHPHRCDEASAMVSGDAPDVIAKKLSVAKAESLRGAFPDGWILGSDQVVDLDGAVLGKPGTRSRAVSQLAALSGRTHRLITGVALCGPGGSLAEHLDVHRMSVRSLAEGEIERYVDADEPLDCCGAYKIERLGITLFDRIEGDDFTSIVGLPLMAVARMLREAGWSLP
ncbi:MAG: nucleoside triphosphate pyrophosphatase [Myxococcota bacterium]